MKTTASESLFAAAQNLIPGGVNSPVRAFRSVGGTPLFIKSAKGATIVDADGNRFIDYVGSWGPMILGHADSRVLDAVCETAVSGLSFGAPCELEVRMAELITAVAPVEMVRMVNSGTEAVMAALRLARGYTGKDKIIKFSGCYHGHADAMLVKAGSGALTGDVPDSPGVPAAVAADTLTAQFNDLGSVQRCFADHADIAAIIVEPVAANMGVIPPASGFLEGLRELCAKNGALLIFDEVITGFRLAPGGAQQYFGIEADLVTYGKIIGGGMPVGAYAGKREIMSCMAPTGPIYQAGTLSGNPVAMAAGIAQLRTLAEIPDMYGRLDSLGARLENGLNQAADDAGLGMCVNRVGSVCCAYFNKGPVTDYQTATASDTAAFVRYFKAMLERGIYLAPSQFEAMFICNAHTEEMIDKTILAARESLGL